MKGKIAVSIVAISILIIAPVLLFSQDMPREKASGANWVNFKDGSWIKMKAMEIVTKQTLKSRAEDEIVIITEAEIPGMPTVPREEKLSLKTEPSKEKEAPQIIKTYKEEITIAGKKFKCMVIEAKDEWENKYGEKQKGVGKLWCSDEVPAVILDRGVVQLSMHAEGEKEANVIFEYAGEEEIAVGDKKIKCVIFIGESMKMWSSNEVPGMQVKIVLRDEEGKETVMFELIDFEVK